GRLYAFGSAPGQIAAHATVACLCRPLRPDSVRGTYRLATRGLRQLTGRVDATLYFTEGNDTTRHVTYSLHQRLDAIKLGGRYRSRLPIRVSAYPSTSPSE